MALERQAHQRRNARLGELFESDWLLPLVYGSLSYSR
jgi:hypothetical protein